MRLGDPFRATLTALAIEYGRPIDHWDDVGDGDAVPVFVPPLSPAEQAVYDDLATMARFGVTLTLAEWRSIKEDAAGLKQYLGVASPTAAQTATATKAIVRVLGTIIRS